jgi:hypothetical protein
VVRALAVPSANPRPSGVLGERFQCNERKCTIVAVSRTSAPRTRLMEGHTHGESFRRRVEFMGERPVFGQWSRGKPSALRVCSRSDRIPVSVRRAKDT